MTQSHYICPEKQWSERERAKTMEEAAREMPNVRRLALLALKIQEGSHDSRNTGDFKWLKKEQISPRTTREKCNLVNTLILAQ